ncbi:hypothetical protein [Nonomuraea sp. SBT364]|uniref:hypothetical protein n=1 Tax=Nonomuraea sp. SBT364 TaxID=1580530 RepID=UPI000A4FA7C1|nr:hypothetical protein [Nonomuraea sp. SBT364]
MRKLLIILAIAAATFTGVAGPAGVTADGPASDPPRLCETNPKIDCDIPWTI